MPTAWHSGAAANEPDDHVGLEFVVCWRYLLGRGRRGGGRVSCARRPRLRLPAASCDLASDAACDPAALADAAAFLSNHVLVFSGSYLKNLRMRARTPFYRAVAEVAAATLEALAAALGAHAAETLDGRGSRFPHSL